MSTNRHRKISLPLSKEQEQDEELPPNNDDDIKYRRNPSSKVRKIPRSSLVDPTSSPWEKIFTSRNNGALITVTGFDHATFALLEAKFTPFFETSTPHDLDGYIRPLTQNRIAGGRPRKVNARSCLGLTLTWNRFTGGISKLQLMFGFTGTNLATWLRFGRQIIIGMLETEEMTSVKMPSDERVLEYCEAIGQTYPSLADCFCVCGGLTITLRRTGRAIIPDMFCNGLGHFLKNLFVFAPDGMILAALLNVPGCLEDSDLVEWGGIYSKLESTFNRTGAKCIFMDPEFAPQQHQPSAPFIIKASQDLTAARTPAEAQQISDANALRPAAEEWGMRALKVSFPRLEGNFIYEENGERREILHSIVMLYNYRCYNVGRDHLTTVFPSEWSKDLDEILNIF